MAASRFIEQETGTYTGFRHQHNGYYAGDFTQSSRSGSELRRSYAERRDVRLAAEAVHAIPEVISSVRTGAPLPSR